MAAQAVTPAPAPKPKEENTQLPPMQRTSVMPELPRGMVPPAPIPGQGKLFITVHTVQNVPNVGETAPYPYVVMALEGVAGDCKARTVTRRSEDNPSFGEKEFVFGVDDHAAEMAKVHFKLYNWNLGNDEQLGSVFVDLADVAQVPLQHQALDVTDPSKGGSQIYGSNNGLPTRAIVSMRWSPAKVLCHFACGWNCTACEKIIVCHVRKNLLKYGACERKLVRYALGWSSLLILTDWVPMMCAGARVAGAKDAAHAAECSCPACSQTTPARHNGE